MDTTLSYSVEVETHVTLKLTLTEAFIHSSGLFPQLIKHTQTLNEPKLVSKSANNNTHTIPARQLVHCALLHNVQELLGGDFSVLVAVELVDHGLQLLLA